MSYTIEDLDEAIEEGAFLEDAEGEGWGALIEELWEVGTYNKATGEWEYANDKTVTIPGIGAVSKVEEFGGEGQGDDYWVVVKVVDESGEERLFRRNGWYASYDGGYYEGPTDEVVEAQQVITVYNKV